MARILHCGVHQDETGKKICLYWSEKMAWIRQFSNNIIELKQVGLQLDTIYPKKKNGKNR